MCIVLYSIPKNTEMIFDRNICMAMKLVLCNRDWMKNIKNACFLLLIGITLTINKIAPTAKLATKKSHYLACWSVYLCLPRTECAAVVNSCAEIARVTARASSCR